jgi:Ca-activated chloride channel family protein
MSAGDPMAGAAWFTLGAPELAQAFWSVPAVGALLVLASWLRRRALRRYAGEPWLTPLTASVRPVGRAVVAACVLGACAALAAALVRPRTDPRPIELPTRGRDIVFVVDVSRSMLAQDLAPSRLERAKLWIRDMTAALDGDRVALVAFAGAPAIRSPLTLDRAFFRMQLDTLSPESAPLGGSLIGDAIRKTVHDVFGLREEDGSGRPEDGAARDIVLITDGEDQESFPVEAAAEAGRRGIRVIAIGIGGAGAAVPDAQTGGEVVYQGQPVRSALDAGLLADIAAQTPGGVFLNVGTGEVDLARVDRELLGTGQDRQTGRQVTMRYTERFMIPLALAMALLAVEMIVPTSRGRRSKA